MALTTQMMDILIAEYFNDPEKLGYRKYGNMDGGHKFYIPQILELINSPRDQVLYTSTEENVEYHDVEHVISSQRYKHAIKRSSLPPRISDIFAGIPGAPNSLTEGDLLIALNYYITNTPGAVAPGQIVRE